MLFNITTATFVISISSECRSITTYRPTGEVSKPVPLVELYNKVQDGQPVNFEACTQVAEVTGMARRTLRVSAANGYGHIDIVPEVHDHYVVFMLSDMSNWHADAEQKHLRFGIFWEGILRNATAPLVMGRMMGALGLRGLGQEPAPSAGFVTISRNTYYNSMYFATTGTRLAFTFVPTEQRDDVWRAIGKAESVLFERPSRFFNWYWTSGKFNEANRDVEITRAKALGADLLFILEVTDDNKWANPYTVNRTRFPSGINETASYIRSQGLQVGFHTEPIVINIFSEIAKTNPAALMPEGLAPTYRSGCPPPKGYRPPMYISCGDSEDLGFWWGHQLEGNLVHNGNPRPCGQSTCIAKDWATNDWAPDIKLVGAHWSQLGAYRNGSSVGFDGVAAYGMAPHHEVFEWLRCAITIGMVVHRVARQGEGGGEAGVVETLATKGPIFSLTIENDRLVWKVRTSDGHTVQANGKTALKAGVAYIVKACFSVSTGQAVIFVDNAVDGSATMASAAGGLATSSEALAFGAALSKDSSGKTTPRDAFSGALEEMYLKNVSTADRPGYLYADSNRPYGSYLIDFSSEAGRKQYADGLASLLNAADEVQTADMDGMEKPLLIAAKDFPHSAATRDSGALYGLPAPDQFHVPWPIRTGLGVIEAMEMAHRQFNPLVTVEAPFLTPGLGPFRPGLAAFDDEKDMDMVEQGLEWHPRMLFRTEISGAVQNTYNCRIYNFKSAEDADYWLGGLVVGGFSPQVMDSFNGSHYVAHDATIAKWMRLRHIYGHAIEGGVRTLRYDSRCCHIMGECEGAVCRDIILSKLVEGTRSTSTVGVYVGDEAPVVVPMAQAPNGTLACVFLARGVKQATLAFGEAATTHFGFEALSDARLVLSGDFFSGSGRVEQTLLAANGTALSRQTLPPASRGVTVSIDLHQRLEFRRSAYF